MNEPSSQFLTAFGRQRGAALLIFMLIFFMASMSWLLSQGNAIQSRLKAEQVTAAALALAREALIGRAVIDDNRPGSLPCPDIDDDGLADGDFGFCSTLVGRLPWKRLDLPDLRDGEGNHLWYALAGELQDNNDAPAINPKLPLSLTLDGTTNIAAIVFSAGPPLAGKSGRPSNDIDDYLDDTNRDGSPYVSGPVSASFNDKTLSISRDQLFSVVNRRILRQILTELEKYYQLKGSYPKTDDNLTTELNIDAESMLSKNEWLEVTKYEASEDPQSATLAISVSPATSCTITPTQEPSCTYP